ncbi:hypothetical protein BT93_C1527 [Corymbia citriodora subsp. variegata]|nr:hypothetical protein BT93_C1527 [Corymbia citriodora subsp. variegata]
MFDNNEAMPAHINFDFSEAHSERAEQEDIPSTLLATTIRWQFLLLNSVGEQIMLLASIGMCLTIVDQSNMKLMWVVALLCYMAFFFISIGLITRVHSSKIFLQRLHTLGCVIDVAVKQVVSAMLWMMYVSLYNAITIGRAFFLFAAVASVTWEFFCTMTPYS